MRSQVQLLLGPPLRRIGDGLAKLSRTKAGTIGCSFAVSVGVRPPSLLFGFSCDGALAQLGERLLCKHQVIGSIPIGSTRLQDRRRFSEAKSHLDQAGQRCIARHKSQLCCD